MRIYLWIYSFPNSFGCAGFMWSKHFWHFSGCCKVQKSKCIKKECHTKWCDLINIRTGASLSIFRRRRDTLDKSSGLIFITGLINRDKQSSTLTFTHFQQNISMFYNCSTPLNVSTDYKYKSEDSRKKKLRNMSNRLKNNHLSQLIILTLATTKENTNVNVAHLNNQDDSVQVLSYFTGAWISLKFET